MAAQVRADLAAHKEVCEQIRKNQDAFMGRMERTLGEMSASNRNALDAIKLAATEAVTDHAAEDRENFKGIYTRLWAIVGGSNLTLLSLVAFLAGKMLHWI